MLEVLYLFSLGILGSFVEATPRATCESLTCNTTTHITKLPKANFLCAGETCCDNPGCAYANVQEETCGAKGHWTILKQDDCQAIASANGKPLFVLSAGFLPSGCFYWPTYTEPGYFFNPNSDSTENCSTNQQCECERDLSDIDACCDAKATCDTMTCNSTHSLVDAALSTYCENTTCTEEADFDSCCEENESCENIVCNPLTHLTKIPRSDYFCSGECGTTPETTYISVTENTCDSLGYYPVATEYECEKLAQNNNRIYKGYENVSIYPAGCYFFGDYSAYLNLNIDSSSECNPGDVCQCIPLDVHTCCTPGEESCNEYTCSDANKVMKDDFTLCEIGGCNDNTCCVDRDTCDSFSCDSEIHVPKTPAANFLCTGASCTNRSRVTSYIGVNTTNCIELGYNFVGTTECKTLAADTNRGYIGVLNDQKWPTGCFFHGDSEAAYNVYINIDMACGAANATCQCKTLVDSQDAKACCNAKATCSSHECSVTNVLKHNHSSITCPTDNVESCSDSLCCAEKASCDTFACPNGLLPKTNSSEIYCQGEICSNIPTDMPNFDRYSFPTEILTNSSCEAEGYFDIDELSCFTIAMTHGKPFHLRYSFVLPHGCLYDQLYGAYYQYNRGTSLGYSDTCDSGGRRNACLCSSFQTDVTTCCTQKVICPENICNQEERYIPTLSTWDTMCAGSVCVENEPACCVKRATCDTFTCNSETHLPKANASTIYCANDVCTASSDTDTCCNEIPPCSSVANPLELCRGIDSYAPYEDYHSRRCTGISCIDNDPSCCEWLPPCSHTVGIYLNKKNCFCGQSKCWGELGLGYCVLSTETCSDTPGCTPPLKKNQSGLDPSKNGCEGSFQSVSLASLYARIGADETCASYDSEGWASIEDSKLCKEVAEIFDHPYKVDMTRDYGCGLDEDGSLYFGRGFEESLIANFCMRK